MDNQTIARHLLDYADQLERRESTLYRVRAYRRAAQAVLELDRPVADLIAERGRDGLEALPGIGWHLAYTIEGLVKTGEFRTFSLDDGQTDRDQMLTTLPGIGPGLARRLHDKLGITRMEDLEQAAFDGRLAEIGVGPKRLRGLIDSLAGRRALRKAPDRVVNEPDVASLLAVDREYRAAAGQIKLQTVGVRRFYRWRAPRSPVWQLNRNGWYYRAAFSKSPLAYRQDQINDRVEIHFDNGQSTGRRTIITETRGDLRGRRVVLGRESECRKHCQLDGPEVAAHAAG